MSPSHIGCPFYTSGPAFADPPPVATRRWQVVLPAVAVVALLAIVGTVYGRDLLAPPRNPQAPTVPIVAATSTPPGQATATRSVATKAATARPTTARFATPTPEPGGRTVVLEPRPGDVGWWSSDEDRGSHLGDSFLHAGYYDGKVFIAAFRLDLRSVPRGAPIRAASLRLTGLQGDRLGQEADGSWTVQLLPSQEAGELERMGFQAIFNAPSAVTLLPALEAGDLEPHRANSWDLGRDGEGWLAQQLLDGVPAALVRIIGPVGGTPSLFAWDSGAGPATAGEGPELVLSLGPAPEVAPPVPTQPAVVLASTSTPENVLTAAAYSLEATRSALTVGTYTPLPPNVVTPTPQPINLATVQAQGLMNGLPPVVVYTPTPANQATATAQAAYATAVAVTTGTFTPVPTNAVTPVIVAPTPWPENVVTAAAQSLAATEQARRVGTPTPLPPGAIIATVTPAPYVYVPSPTPANVATARWDAAYATAVAVTTGTFTPMPPGSMRATPFPSPTPLPLVIFGVTPRPTPSPTPALPGHMPELFRGKVLFWSDRDGPSRLFLLDPTSGRIDWVTQEWPFAQAQALDSRAPDGRAYAFVHTADAPRDAERVPHIFVDDGLGLLPRQITFGSAWNYDPSWSPRAGRIAFVSQSDGNDEIYTADLTGHDLRRLTANTWEWDKHPSWSPDGSQIVFWSNRSTGRKQLWVMNADGSGQRKLLESPYNDWDPIWVR